MKALSIDQLISITLRKDVNRPLDLDLASSNLDQCPQTSSRSDVDDRNTEQQRDFVSCLMRPRVVFSPSSACLEPDPEL